jgi:hypothetical protein
MKKVIISETQLKQIVIHEECEDMIAFALNESINLQGIKQKIKKALIAGVTVAVILSAISKLNISDAEKNELKQMVQTEIATDSVPQQDTIHDQKVQACKEYMEWAMKNQGYDWSSTQLSPEALVTACEKNDFNLAFTMAVANLESCFGCTPRSKKENSVFSVGAYDNGKNVCSYASQDESIVPFINLIKNDYLVGEKTIDDLLVPNQFVNHIGLRYAKGAKYEGQVKSIMNRIIRMYPILGQ